MSKRFSLESAFDGYRNGFFESSLLLENLRSYFNESFKIFDQTLRNLIVSELGQDLSTAQVNVIRDSHVFVTNAQGQEAGYHAKINWDWEVLDCNVVEFVLLLRRGYNPVNLTINSLKFGLGGLNFSEGLSVSLEELRLRHFMYQPGLSLAENGANQELLSKLEINSQLISALRGFAVPRNYSWDLKVSSYQDAGLVFLSDVHLSDTHKKISFINELMSSVDSLRNIDDAAKALLRQMMTLELGNYFLGLANKSLEVLG